MLQLADFDMSPERGFLCRHDAAAVQLPGVLAQAASLALQLPQLLPGGRVRRELVNALPDTDLSQTIAALDDTQARRAMVHYSFMVQAYVWGEPNAPTHLPRVLAVPIVELAQRLGQQPLLPYSAYVLDNWGLLQGDGAPTLDNTYMIQHFLGGQDEAWFVLIHVAIEATAGRALASMGPLLTAINEVDRARARDLLDDMAGVWEVINGLFDRMPERCDPYIYFERVRPYIHGWRDNPALPGGLIYEGVESFQGRPQVFRGQTGSQSSIVPAMDALLGIGHAADPLRSYLDELHQYRPPAHRRFVDEVRSLSRLRQFVCEQKHDGLTAAYNANVQAVADFRSRHLEYAASYINKQHCAATGNHTEVGTGGTPFMRYLKKHRNETRANLIVD